MKRFALLFGVLLLVATHAFGQDPATGYPPYGSFENGRFDGVNLQNLNVNFVLPVVASPGRGLSLRFSIVYDSLVWKIASGAWTPVTDASGNPIWGWKKSFVAGSISYRKWTGGCIDPDTHKTLSDTYWSGYVYKDPAGTAHAFSISEDSVGICTSNTAGSYATDASGYYMDATNPDAPVAYSPGGVKITNGGTMTDPNGNFLSNVVVSSTETDWKDTLGRTALKIITSPTAVQYQFLDPTGNYQTATLNLQQFSIKTNFGCSNVVEYNGSAYLPTSLVLPNNQSYQFTYEQTPTYSGYYTGRLQRVTLPTGGYYEYDYTGANDSINCADGTVTNLQRVINDGSTSATWQFTRSSISGSAGTTTVTAPQLPYDAAANQTVITFDSNGHETSRKVYQGSSSSGTLLRTINTTWSGGAPATRITILTDTNQQFETDTSFDSYGNLLQLVEHDWGSGTPGAVLRTTSYTYLNGTSYLSRNIVNRLASEIIQDGPGVIQFRKTIAYDASGYINSPCISGAVQHDDTNYGCTYTTRGNPTSVTVYLGASSATGGITKNFTYDSLGNLVKADVDCCQQEQWNFSATTQYAYPDSVVRGPSGGPQLTTSSTFNSSTGLVATSTDENGQTTSFSYDYLKRLTTITRPDNAQITYAYNDAQRTVTVTTPIQSGSSQQQVTTYDGLGRPVSITTEDSSGAAYSTVATQYDPVGRPYKVSNPYTGTAQYWTTTQLNALGRPTKVILPDSNLTTYAYSGATTTVTDPIGKQQKLQTDAAGHLVSVFEPDVTNGNSLTQQTTYTYTVLDAPRAVGQGVQVRNYYYDGLGRLTSAVTPEGGTVSYQYNNFDLVTQRTDARGVVTTYSYDTLNRLMQVGYNVGTSGVPATATVSFTYGTSASQNNNGRLVTMTDGVGSESYTYDVLGRITQVQKVISATTYSTGYAYNQVGGLTQLTYPSGRQVQQSYDPIGRPSAIASGTTNYASAFTYNPAFETTRFNCGNGVTASFGYSPDRLQMTSLSYTKGTQTLFSLNYSYAQNGGNDGEITSITDAVDAGRNLTYTYDALGRLSTAVTQGSTNYPKWGLSFIYDRYGNRTAQTVTAGTGPSNAVTIDPNTNRISGTPYSYDANGNMTNDGLNSLSYDAENRLVSSSGSQYSYDGNSLRVQKVSGGTTTVYIFSGAKVIAEYLNGAAPASPTREYVYSASVPLAKIEAGVTNYYYPDHLSPRLTTDASGNVVGQQGHYPFGEAWYMTNTTTKWQFTGYERDPESGNDYAMARYNVNRLGRFSSPDLLGGSVFNPQSLNRYSYVTDNPANLVDPSGLCWYGQAELACTDFGGGGGGGGGISPASESGDPFAFFNPVSQTIGGHRVNSDILGTISNQTTILVDLLASGANGSDVVSITDSSASFWIHPCVTTAEGGTSCEPPQLQTVTLAGPSFSGNLGNSGSSLGNFLTGPGGLKDQGKVFLSALVRNFVDEFTPNGCFAQFANELVTGQSADASPPGAAPEDVIRSAGQAGAAAYVVSKGLAYPLKSSVYRGILGLTEDLAGAVALVPVLRDEVRSLIHEVSSLRSGRCQ